MNLPSASEGYWLKQAVKSSGLTVQEFAKKVGIGRSTLHGYFVQPVLEASADTLFSIMDALKIETDWLRRRYSQDLGVANTADQRDDIERHWRSTLRSHIKRVTAPEPYDSTDDISIEIVGMRRIPYFDVNIPAGGWSESCEGRQIEEADGFIEVPSDAPRDAFAFRIRGDSMEEKFPDGAVIVCVPLGPGEGSARQFVSGKPYYFQHSDGKCTFKNVHYEPPKHRYRLESINKKYKPLFVPEQMLGRMSVAIKMVVELT